MVTLPKQDLKVISCKSGRKLWIAQFYTAGLNSQTGNVVAQQLQELFLIGTPIITQITIEYQPNTSGGGQVHELDVYCDGQMGNHLESFSPSSADTSEGINEGIEYHGFWPLRTIYFRDHPAATVVGMHNNLTTTSDVVQLTLTGVIE